MITPPTTDFVALSPFLSPFQSLLWGLYLVAAVALPAHHIRPVLKYLRGDGGIGDACVRTETHQCLWRVPALLFALFVTPSLPLCLSVLLDIVGRIARIVAMRVSQRRWQQQQARGAGLADGGPDTEPAAWPVGKATLGA